MFCINLLTTSSNERKAMESALARAIFTARSIYIGKYNEVLNQSERRKLNIHLSESILILIIGLAFNNSYNVLFVS
jgi:hypothetical protein